MDLPPSRTHKSAHTSGVDPSRRTTGFPPLLTVAQAAELLQVPTGTVYDWRSQGLLDQCSFRVGGHVRINQDLLLSLAMNGRLSGAKRRK